MYALYCGSIYPGAMPLERRRMHCGFTLVELLVVIAVIVLLAALFCPVIAAVREKGRQTACISNMRQLGLALQQYAQDNDEQSPNGTFHNRFLLNTGWAGRLYPYVKDIHLYGCPDDPTGTQVGPAGLQAYPVSYALNLNLSWAPRLASQTAPAKTVLLIEVTGDSAPVRQPEEWRPGLDMNELVSPAADGLDNDIWATNNSAGMPARLVRYATGEMDNFEGASDGSANNSLYGGEPRHQDGANYLAADGHMKFLLPKAVSAGRSANAPSDVQAHQGCAAGLANSCQYCAACAEGTALGQHTLTFSVN